MKKTVIILAILAAATAVWSFTRPESMDKLTDRVFLVAEQQCAGMAQRLTAETLPRSFTAEGEFVSSPVKWWCSGFFPGTLWYVYEYTGSDEIRRLAEEQTAKIEPMKLYTKDHDVGFQINCSFGNGLRLTGNDAYREVMCEAARSLATRFNWNVGCTKSWDFVNKGRDWKFPVIIDNMMNLELLMTAAELCGNDTLRRIAIAHAETTMKNHFRDDFTTWHLVDYDPETGAVRTKHTVQGFSDDSAWARGQAWALYGYTMMYVMSGQERFLQCAQNIGDMLLERLPEDGIPYWDFDSPLIPGDLRDASAGAIMASAYVALSAQTKGKRGDGYLKMAERQLRTLASEHYLAQVGDNGNFILKHSVGNKPGGGEVDVPLTYADYYFLEALIRYKQLKN